MADAMRLPLQQFHFMYCFTFTLYCTVIVARINYLSIYLSILLALTLTDCDNACFPPQQIHGGFGL